MLLYAALLMVVQALWICLLAHRLRASVADDRARIVAWLRRDSTRDTEPAAWGYADAIERGDDTKGGE